MTTMGWLLIAFFLLGAARGWWPVWREHRRARIEQLRHRHKLWVSFRARGYEVTTWEIARKTGQLLQDSEWNEIQATLELQADEAMRHG